MASTYSIIGQPLPARVDGTGKVTGVTRYADDLFLPRMLYGKLLRSPHPHARLVHLDTSKADRKSTRLNSSHFVPSRMPSSA